MVKFAFALWSKKFRRLSEAGHRIPIIFITAHADDEQERRASEAGAIRFLYKPFSQEALLQAVRSALGEP